MKDKPFPWTCGNCATQTVYPEKHSYSCKKLYQGKLYKIDIPEMDIPTCKNCGSQWFSIGESDIIEAAFLKLLNGV